LHVGILAGCVIDPSTVPCLKRMPGTNRVTQLITLCDPASCPNAGFPERHAPVWVGATDNASILLARGTCPRCGTRHNVVISIASRLFPME
jgi:hypothetical protein